MKDFGAWFAEQGKDQPGETREEDDTYLFRCRCCGKEEYVSMAAYDNGDVAWYAMNDDFEHAVCGGGPFCLP